MTALRGFPCVGRRSAHTLILGSMPGTASLLAGEYYAHPRNAFWPILCDLLGVPAGASYARRLDAMQRAGLALWDVIASCERPGSLDAHIRRDTIMTNDFDGLFREHPRIRRVFFNGGTAEQLFRRHVLPGLGGRELHVARLPSTSPAHAGMSLAQKRDTWRVILASGTRSAHGVMA